jgi:Carboxypeptidase regulatory-like domain/TonB dependent receptor
MSAPHILLTARTRQWLVGAIAVALGFFAAAQAARAQSTLGTIRGVVRDTQQQVIPNAAVLVVDEDTGVPRATGSDDLGNFEVPNLRPGNYRVEVTAPGFKTFNQAGVLLRTGDTVRVETVLEVGGASETVTVSADASTIQRDSQAIQSGLDAQQLQTLPRSGRDFQDFLYLNPNVVGDQDNGFKFLGGRTYGASYIQDGQPSTGGIFGSITNAAPGLDAISEVKVLSNSYSAEFGGLAGVVVTTRRGTNRFSGSTFYDFNADELNARSYAQTLAGISRDDPVLDTSDHRYGGSIGGPLRRDKTFFLLNYEGSQRTQVGGGTISNVPSAAMRRGDFSGNTFTVRDPRTGQPFPGNVIPSDRLDPAALEMLSFFYPEPNLSPLANGLGRYQEFTNLKTTRRRWDGRVDHELSRSDSVFVRGSWQYRDPGTFLEYGPFPHMGVQDRKLTATTVTGSWTKVLSNTRLNEFRMGYNQDRSNRKSQYDAQDLAGQFGIEFPETGLGRRGFQALTFSGANSIRGITDPSQNANRDTRQSFFTIADTATWIAGRHSLKFGGHYSRNMVVDGFSLGVTGAAGAYTFGGLATGTGNSFSDFLLGLPLRSVQGINTRGTDPLDATSQEFALFVQDDWKVNEALTVFAGARYEYIGNFVEKNDLLINFEPVSGSLILPNAEIADFLSPGARQTVPQLLASDVGVGRSLVNADANNISPRVGFAWRLNPATVLRGGAGYFYPTAAAQGIRDSLSRSPFRYSITRNGPTLQQAFSTGTPSTNLGFGVNAVDLDLESAEVLQYNLTLEREVRGDIGLRVSVLGSRLDKLILNRDANTMPASTVFFDLEDATHRQRLPYPNLGTFLNTVYNGGEGWFAALQLEGRRRFKQGFGLNVAYTWAGTESTAPDLGNSSLGVVQYDPYDLEKDRGPDPQVPTHRLIADATWDIPVGRDRRYLGSMPTWADAIVGGWTLTGIFQARSGFHVTPYYAYGTDPYYPANTGRGLETVPFFGESWRPDVVGDPEGARDRNNWFNLDAFTLAAPGTTGNARRGIIEGPGTWVVNLGLYKTVVRTDRYRAEVRVTFDNAFNHPQFFVDQDSSMLNLTDFLINGIRDNGVTNVVTDLGSVEAFSTARAIRLGLRLTF